MSDFNIGFVVFPGITQLDFTGPFEVSSRLGTPPSISVPNKGAMARAAGAVSIHVPAKAQHLSIVLVRGMDCIDVTSLLDLKPDRCLFTPIG